MMVCGVAFQFVPVGWPLAVLAAVFGVVGVVGALGAKRLLDEAFDDPS